MIWFQNPIVFVLRLRLTAFKAAVRVCDNAFSASLTDCETDEPYTLHLVESAEGSFVGGVRSAYEALLEKIAAQCCYGDIFKSAVSKAVISVIREKYGDELEFLDPANGNGIPAV